MHWAYGLFGLLAIVVLGEEVFKFLKEYLLYRRKYSEIEDFLDEFMRIFSREMEDYDECFSEVSNYLSDKAKKDIVKIAKKSAKIVFYNKKQVVKWHE